MEKILYVQSYLYFRLVYADFGFIVDQAKMSYSHRLR